MIAYILIYYLNTPDYFKVKDIVKASENRSRDGQLNLSMYIPQISLVTDVLFSTKKACEDKKIAFPKEHLHIAYTDEGKSIHYTLKCVSFKAD